MVWKECLWRILREVDGNPLMSEDELYSVLVRAGFFEELGYGRFGVDVRPQYVVPGERKKADYVCRDEYQNVIFVLEAKKPREERLEDALNQLWERYVLPLKAFYGVLTNGKRFIVYKRVGFNAEPLLDFNLKSATEADCNQLHRVLKKPEYDVTLHSRVQEYFAKVEKLSLKTELAKENFFETFKLDVDSIFGRLVIDLMRLFDWVYPRSKFLKGAYGFWRRSFAREPEKIPDSWKPFLKGDGDVFKFMFCLESAHALLARLILAKACEDLKFPGIGISNFVVQKIHQFRGQIPVVGYPIVLLKLLKEMKDQLVYSIFEEDIFSWWSDAFVPLSEKSSGELLQEKVDEELESFSETIARLLFILYKYDFSEVAGDPLGDLYQQYFDKETRKALGEFYTPVEVVNYILDVVEYKYVRHKRLLDPACGSGTFLVEALKRYLREMEPVAKEKGWAYVLRELCNSPRIVGFDIHPFACLIAQVRFMLELIPYYKKALEEEKMRVYEALQRLPIFRTDSLAIEINPQEFQLGPKMLVTDEDIRFIVTLPMKANGEGTVKIEVQIPSWKKASSGTQYNLFNLDEYFCVNQALFDAVKAMARVESEEVPAKGLEAYIKKYLDNKEFRVIADFFKRYADLILREIQRLKTEFEDGRLIKSIEDAVLSALLKNCIQYDYVVGNPPYVKTQMFIQTSRYIKETYKTAHGNFDIYVPFVQRGIDLLKQGGFLGLIVSNMFHNRDYGEKLRAYILENCIIKEFINFGASGVFEDVTNYPCILIIIKGKNKDNVIRCVRVAKKRENILAEIKKHKEKRYSDDFMDIFEYNQNELTSGSWALMPPEEKVVFDKIWKARECLLKEICDPRLGIKEATRTGANSIFLIDESKADTLCIEKELLVPKIKGADEIKRWHILWDGKFILFPYVSHNGIFVPININDYPNTMKYLISFKTKLEKRRLFNKTILQHGKKWYELWNPLPYKRLKIVYPEISNRNSFALDENDYYCVGKNFIIYLNSDRREDYIFLLALLNSKVLEFFFKHYASIKRQNYFEYMGNVGELPIVINVDFNVKKEIIEKVEEILQKKNSCRFTQRFPSAYVEKYQTQALEFDVINYTFRYNHSKLEPILSGQPGKEYVVYPSKGEDPIWVETVEKAQYLILALSGRDVRHGEIFQIIIPKDNAIVKNVLEDVRREIRRIENIPIEKLESEIDELVFRIYGLDEHDKYVIESFLRKF